MDPQIDRKPFCRARAASFSEARSSTAPGQRRRVPQPLCLGCRQHEELAVLEIPEFQFGDCHETIFVFHCFFSNATKQQRGGDLFFGYTATQGVFC